MTDPRVAQTRRRVLRAAADLLAEAGFERLSIEAIAERSGVARSTIYRNWGDRSGLLTDAFDELCQFSEVPDLGSLERELTLLATEVTTALRTADWAQALPSLVGAAHHDDGLAAAKQAFSERRRAMTAAIFERAIERGEIGADADPGRLAEYFSAPIFFRFLMTHWPIDAAFVVDHVAATMAIAAGGRSRSAD